MVNPNKYAKCVTFVSGQLTPEEDFPRLGLGFGSRLELVLGLGVSQTIAPEENSPQLRLGFVLGLVVGLGGNCPRTVIFIPQKLLNRSQPYLLMHLITVILTVMTSFLTLLSYYLKV